MPEILLYPTLLVPLLLAACSFRLRQRMHHLDFLARHLSALLQRNLPLVGGLEALAGDASLGLARRFRRIAKALRTGKSFWMALDAERGWFPAPFTAVTRAGEETGALAGLIVPAAATIKAESEFRVHLFGYLAYATFLLWYLSLTANTVHVYVWPSLGMSLGTAGAFPPGLELGLWIAQALWAGLTAVGIVLVYVELVHPHLGRFLPFGFLGDLVMTWTPGLGRLVRRSSAARHARVLAVLLEAGLPTGEALDRAARAESHGGLRRRYTRVAESVRQGATLGESFRRGGLPEPLPWLAAAAEGGGLVPEALRSAATALEARLLSTLALVQRTMLPALVLTVGFAVGCIGAAMFQALTDLLREYMW